MDANQTSRIDALLSHRRPVEAELAEIAAEIERLQDRLGRLPGVVSAYLAASVQVARAEDVKASGVRYPLSYTDDGSRVHTFGYVSGVTVRHVGLDHDLLAENAPDECASSSYFADGSAHHYFYKLNDTVNVFTRVVASPAV